MNKNQDILFTQEKAISVNEVDVATNNDIKSSRCTSPIFIVGFSRTGSTLLQNLLNTYTEVCIVPELHIHWPKRLHNDFANSIQRKVGDLRKDENVDTLIDLCYSKSFKGTFWEVIDRIGMDRNDLRRRVLDSDRSIGAIFDAIMTSVAVAHNKQVIGAKFPVHFSYVDKLIEWYPKCRIVHTIRDPRAIYASQYYKRSRQAGNAVKKILTAIIQFIHVTISYRGVSKMHDAFQYADNYYLFRYEDFILCPEKSLIDLCRFVEIQFNPNMLNPKIFYNTSFNQRKVSRGIHRSSLNAWKTKVPGWLALLIRMANRRPMERFGYL